jgi:hypothetical protein
MPLCFIEPEQAIRVVAESIGREARRQLLGEIVHAWVDEIPDDELVVHYAKAVEDLDEDDLSMLAAWHASLEVGNTEICQHAGIDAQGLKGGGRECAAGEHGEAGQPQSFRTADG